VCSLSHAPLSSPKPSLSAGKGAAPAAAADAGAVSDYASITPGAVKKAGGSGGGAPGEAGWRDGQVRPPIGRDASEKPSDLMDMLPDWVGYGALYLFSSIPIIIVIVTISILFTNSLR
jgi:hypothetical protein